MGFKFRKTIGKGPFKVTLSKSGVSTSVGVKGARVSVSSKGKARATVGLPGTGLSYSKSFGSKKKKSTSKGKTPAKKNSASRASAQIKSDTASAAPIKRSWPMAIIMPVLSFAVVGGISFVIAFILYAIISLFNSGFGSTFGAKILVFGIPAAFALLSAFFAFQTCRPETDPDRHDE